MLKERRTHPPMPLTLQPTGRNDDSALDHISAEDCYLGNIVQHIERLPTELAQAWVEAYSATLKQVLNTVGAAINLLSPAASSGTCAPTTCFYVRQVTQWLDPGSGLGPCGGAFETDKTETALA
jgi:hypothetical protein